MFLRVKKVILKPGKEKPILSRHHWIFSGALQYPLTCEVGELLPVYSASQHLLGWAYFNPKCSLAGRMVSFGEGDPLLSIEKHLKEALQLRHQLFNKSNTNGYRLVNGEGDLLPGLIVDRYNDSLVLQIGTYGMEKLISFIVDQLNQLLPECTTIYEKSSLPSRKLEGLPDYEGHLKGNQKQTVMLENGLRFLIDFEEGQKTGFFLDQREMRAFIAEYASNKRVLNCFAYSGGFSLYAARKGAIVDSLDISGKALAWAKENFRLNGLEGNFIEEDAFDFLKRSALEYDMIILDPPAFAKKKEDVKNAMSGYRELNRLVLSKMPPGYLLTCSCSYHIDEELFQKLIFQAALMAKREVKILSRHRMAPDHPVNLYHPESDYLKSLFLYVK
jgi:23S rRNA (cytosine1962-C5)-methyltransferase